MLKFEQGMWNRRRFFEEQPFKLPVPTPLWLWEWEDDVDSAYWDRAIVSAAMAAANEVRR